MTEHCPSCLSAAHAWGEQQDGEQTIRTWRCASCHRTWKTSYLTAAYGDPGDVEVGDEPIDDPEDRPGYWDHGEPAWDPRTGW
ncbi:hypothetical protein [Kitasatospora camelliae]|uniref:Uncharacterized protein n=1 Tax=Kitasatospora camelliae TaxID=3156397 RepID=A0AAU8K2S2_9ACTN